MMVSKQMIINDIENCGLSQWFNHKGLCSVFDDGDSYNLLISVGTSLRDENILESYSGLTLKRVLELTKYDEQ